MKKFLAAMLAVCMMFTVLLAGTFSVSADADNYYSYSVSNGEAIITGCDTSISGDVVIPETLDGYPVSVIGPGAFSGCADITSVTIPDSVTAIGAWAFSGCDNITSIRLGKGISYICEYALSGNLTDVWYSGSYADRVKISINPENYMLLNAVWHYEESVPEAGDVSYSIDGTVLTIYGDGVMGYYGTCTQAYMPIYGEELDGYYRTYLEAPWYMDIKTEYGGYSCWDECVLVKPDITKYDVIIAEGITAINSYTLDGSENIDYLWPDMEPDFDGYYDSDPLYTGVHPLTYEVDFNSIQIPESVTYVAPDAFVECDGMVIKGYVGTYAETFALENGYIFEYLDKKPDIKYDVDGTVLTISGEGILGNYSSSVQAPWYMDIKTEYGGYECFSEECDGIDYVTTAKYDVIISEGITSIGSYAFDGSVYVTHPFFPDYPDVMGYHVHELIRDADFTSVQIPASVTYIAPDAFVECDGMVIKGYSGTYAETFANENGYTFESLGKYVPELYFKSASVTLQNSLAFNFKVDSALFTEGAYENPYVVFNMNGKEVKVDTYTVDGDKYVFTLLGISPDKMNDNITATLYAAFEGEEYTAVKEYSVAEYCYNMLAQYSNNETLRTLIVDLLNYGAASQIYSGYNTENLANADLTAEQSVWGSEDVTLNNALDTKYEIVDNATVTWKGAGLTLLENVEMRLYFRAESIDGLSVNVKTADNEWNIAGENFVKSGNYYYVVFDKFGADKMSENIYITVMKDGKKVSNTARYSIESYACAKQNDSNNKLVNLVKAMMRYGNSAKNYK